MMSSATATAKEFQKEKNSIPVVDEIHPSQRNKITPLSMNAREEEDYNKSSLVRLVKSGVDEESTN